MDKYMMEGLIIYSESEILEQVNTRQGETKLGSRVQHVSSLDQIKNSNASFVLVGIPEDIGVRANYGIAGAATAWVPALKALLNIQSNEYFDGEELLILGYFNFNQPENNSTQELQKKVVEIDAAVYPVIQTIVAAGKTPIIIGGGHNNAFPIIKGVSRALNKPIDVINIDAHTDLRAPEGRHSGNPFSHAIKEEFLKNYAIFGLHQNYNNTYILEEIKKNPLIHPIFFDDLLKSDQPILIHWTELLKKTNIPGLEIDLDGVENVLSSASTPSGFSINEIRKMLLTSAQTFAYLHICEGATALSDGRESQSTAKTIAYLVSDFIKAQK